MKNLRVVATLSVLIIVSSGCQVNRRILPSQSGGNDASSQKEDSSAIPGVAPVVSPDGKTLTYGLYPKSHVNDPDLVGKLSSLKPNDVGYCLYNGEYYAKRIATPSDELAPFFDDSTYIEPDVLYWFHCEPIEWDILSSENGERLVVSHELIDATYFGDYFLGTNEEGHTANNYAYSHIREWLNSAFRETAFFQGDSYIKTTHLDNSPEANGIASNPYFCEDTDDQIFLLSFKDYSHVAYGFAPRMNRPSDTRYCRTTDYARCCGAYYDQGANTYYNGYYLTRTPSDQASYLIYGVQGDGGAEHFYPFGNLSVRPAMTLNVG